MLQKYVVFHRFVLILRAELILRLVLMVHMGLTAHTESLIARSALGMMHVVLMMALLLLIVSLVRPALGDASVAMEVLRCSYKILHLCCGNQGMASYYSKSSGYRGAGLRCP